ncbi:MAG: MFS transporter [Promethearchaeia archaeon]
MSEQSASIGRKETNKIQFYLLSFSILLQFAIIGLLEPYIAIYFRREGLPFSILFLIFFANYMGNIVQPVWGGLSDRMDRRKIFLVLGTCVWMIAMIIINFIPEFLIFVIFFGIASLFGSATQPVARSMITLLAKEEEETEYQSKFGVLLTTAVAISGWAGGFIVSYFNFDLLFTLTMIISILSFVLIFSVREHTIEEELNHFHIKHEEDSKFNKGSFKERALELFRNKFYLLILFCSCLGGISFYFFFNFFSVFYVENGGDLTLYSWALIFSFIMFMILNYAGEAIMKRKYKDSVLENNQKAPMGVSEKLKGMFILWAMIGFSFLCVLIFLHPVVPLFMILLVYSLPIVPFFFTSMLALTAKVVEPDRKALAIGIQGVFVFGGRSLSVFLGSQVLDSVGFNLAALIDIFLMISLAMLVIYTIQKLNIMNIVKINDKSN